MYNIRKLILEALKEIKTKSLLDFLKTKSFVNKKSKGFLYHGTNKSPKEFKLRDDYNGEDSNYGNLPEGYLFLTTDIKEAKVYGQYVIPCELQYHSSSIFKITDDAPSVAFDKDFGIDLFKAKKYYNYWGKFMDSGNAVLVIKGLTKSTVITDISNVIPRLDLATEFYGL